MRAQLADRDGAIAGNRLRTRRRGHALGARDPLPEPLNEPAAVDSVGAGMEQDHPPAEHRRETALGGAARVPDDMVDHLRAWSGAAPDEERGPVGIGQRQPKIIGIAAGPPNNMNEIKTAAEFGVLKGGQQMAALLALITDIHSLGLPAAQGLLLTTSFYWDMDDKTR